MAIGTAVRLFPVEPHVMPIAQLQRTTRCTLWRHTRHQHISSVCMVPKGILQDR